MRVQEGEASPVFILKGQDGRARNHRARLAKATNHPASVHEANEPSS
jgi:hypothetical protein